MTRLTASVILRNPHQIECLAGGPVNGKYVGWIFCNKDYWKDIRHRLLVNTDAIYDSREEAVSAMQKIVDDILFKS